MQKANGRVRGRSHSLWTHDFRSVSLPSRGFFSPFPHGTCPLSVTTEYSGLESGLPGFGRGFTCPALLGIPARAEGASRTGLSPSAARLSRRSRSRPPPPVQVPQPPGAGPRVWAWSAFARRYLRNRSFFLFLRLLRCFTSPGLAPAALFGSRGGGILEDAGLPHSETPGSKTACVSPGLIAACRVLLRLPPPRHPPCARTVWTPNSRAPVGPHGPRGRRNGRRRGHVLAGRA